MSHRLAVAYVLFFALLPVRVFGQGLSGSLSGSVKDEQGGILAGATVTVASPAQIGGEQRAIDERQGQWRFPVLAPGVYVLVVEMAPGFAAYREEGISIGAGASIERPVVLKLAGVAQSVTVEAGSSVESRSSGLETRFGPDYLATIPTRRFSMFDAIRSAPGMSPTSPSSGTVNTVSSFGSGVNENAFLIDGTNFHLPVRRRLAGRAERRRHPGSARAVDRRVGRVREHPGRRDQRRHQAGRRAVSVAVGVLRAAIRIDGAADRPPGHERNAALERLRARTIP